MFADLWSLSAWTVTYVSRSVGGMPLAYVVCVLCVSYVFYQIGNSDESSNSGLKAQTQSDANALQFPKV